MFSAIDHTTAAINILSAIDVLERALGSADANEDEPPLRSSRLRQTLTGVVQLNRAA